MLEPVGAWPARRWVRLVLTISIIVLLGIVVVRTLDVLVPFGLGLLLGYIILPLVNRLQRSFQRFLRRGDVSRLLAIFLVYAIGLGAIGIFFGLFVPIIIRQTQQLVANIDEIIAAVQQALAGAQEFLATSLPEEAQRFVQQQLQQLGDRLVAALGGLVTAGLAAIGNVVVVIFGFLIIPVWLIYVLYESDRLRRGFLNLFSESARPDVISVGHIFDDVVGAYVRGQILVAVIVGSLTGFGLAVLGVSFPALLGLITAVGDLIPTVGPILAAIPTVLIAAIQRPILAVWAVLVLVGVQQFESAFIGPRIVGGSVRLSPAIIIVLLVVAGNLWGLIGLLVVVPLAAFLRDVVRYAYLRTASEPLLPPEALHRVRRARPGAATRQPSHRHEARSQ